MKTVREIRDALRDVPEALQPEPVWSDAPLDGERSELWSPVEDEYANLSNERYIIGDDPSLVRDDLTVFVDLPPEIEADSTAPLLSDEAARVVQSRVINLGIEALAWYVPFHQRRYQWGCHLSATGILALADEFRPLNLPPSRRIQLAVHALLRHEATHFAVEYMASQWELSIGAACYWPARTNLLDQSLGFIEVEEKLANAYMLRGFRHQTDATRCPGALNLLRQYTNLQPSGYKHGQFFLDRPRFYELMSDVAHDYVLSISAAQYRPRSRGLDFLSNYPDTFDTRYCPVILVSDGEATLLNSLAIRFIPRIEEVTETPPFQKMLASMSQDVKRAWPQTKKKLARTTELKGLDFKPWGVDNNSFSVRVTGSVRAHLKLDRSGPKWAAYEIGQHKALGHG